MALLVQHLGQYGAHAAAKRAGIKKGDVLISYAGRSDLTTESLLMAESINRHQNGRQGPRHPLAGRQQKGIPDPDSALGLRCEPSSCDRGVLATKIAVLSG